MTILVSNVATTDTFQKLLTTVNRLATVVSNSVVTVGSNAAVGDSSITGSIYSNSVITNNISVSNSIFVGNSVSNLVVNSTSIAISNTTSNLTITIPTTYQVSNGQYFLNANGSYSPLQQQIYNNQINLSSNSSSLIDYWLLSSYKVSEYLISVNDNNANNYYSSKLMIAYNNSGAFSTEYASITSNSYVGSFYATTNSTCVQLYFTPVSTNTTIKFARVTI